MSYIHPAAVEHQRQRWTRPDAYRFAPPGSPEAKPPWERAEPAPAHDAVSAAELDAFYAEHLEVRRQLADIKFALALRRIFRKYSPDQPRVPAGSHEGGQWTSGGGGAGTQLADAGDTSAPAGLVLSDAGPDPIRPSAQLANVIRICMAGSSAISTDRSGNQKYWVEYICADGFTFKNYGVGGKFPAFLVDPRR
jgi:hypothetical protein